MLTAKIEMPTLEAEFYADAIESLLARCDIEPKEGERLRLLKERLDMAVIEAHEQYDMVKAMLEDPE